MARKPASESPRGLVRHRPLGLPQRASAFPTSSQVVLVLHCCPQPLRVAYPSPISVFTFVPRGGVILGKLKRRTAGHLGREVRWELSGGVQTPLSDQQILRAQGGSPEDSLVTMQGLPGGAPRVSLGSYKGSILSPLALTLLEAMSG